MNFIYIILYNFPVFVAKKFNVSYFSTFWFSNFFKIPFTSNLQSTHQSMINYKNSTFKPIVLNFPNWFHDYYPRYTDLLHLQSFFQVVPLHRKTLSRCPCVSMSGNPIKVSRIIRREAEVEGEKGGVKVGP